MTAFIAINSVRREKDFEVKLFMLWSCFHYKGNLVKHNSGCWKMLHKFLSQGQIFIGMAPDEKENALQWHCQSPDPETLSL